MSLMWALEPWGAPGPGQARVPVAGRWWESKWIKDPRVGRKQKGGRGTKEDFEKRGIQVGGGSLQGRALQTEKLMECVEQGLLIPALQGWIRTSSQGSPSGTWGYHCFLL